MYATRWITALLACLAMIFAPGAWARQPKVNEPAPDFQVTTFDGKKLRLADFQGQVLVINFWATWCTPCRTELPLLDAYYKLQKSVGLRIVAVTTEDSLPLKQLKPLAAKLSIPMARFVKGSYNTMGAVPTNYIIDRAGVLRYAKPAAFNLDDLNEILVPLLREQTPRPQGTPDGT